MERIGVLGTGLIGASIGMAVRDRGGHVTGWDPDADVRAAALDVGALDAVAADIEGVLSSAPDLVVIAAPPSATVGLVATLEYPGLVIDVAGVKGPILAASRLPRFVGTHPMAGREVSGPQAASPVLFRGATWVITPNGAQTDDVAAVGRFVAGIGARPIEMTAEHHDAAVAAISHVPQLLAAGLVAAAAEAGDALELAAGSFRDLTRVAASHPDLWVDVLRSNRVAVVAAIGDLRARLDELEESLGDEGDHLEGFLRRSRDIRRSMTARAAVVRVALADQPGELAKVGHAFEATSVDVRDIQLRHAPHGGGGVLTISVRPGHAEALTHALEAEGLLIVE